MDVIARLLFCLAIALWVVDPLLRSRRRVLRALGVWFGITNLAMAFTPDHATEVATLIPVVLAAALLAYVTAALGFCAWHWNDYRTHPRGTRVATWYWRVWGRFGYGLRIGGRSYGLYRINWAWKRHRTRSAS